MSPPLAAPLRKSLATAAFLLVGFTVAMAALINTSRSDYAQPGTQPGTLAQPLDSALSCSFCHGYYSSSEEPYRRWAGGMMANAMRDPVFHAALAIANQDAAFAGDFCLRCHTPTGWLEGRAQPPSGSALAGKDYEGVSCHFCHRLVDPIPDPANPAPDAAILAGLSAPPTDAHNGQFIVDPQDRRRGPFDLGTGFGYHPWEQSPFHREALLCATCHDVSNPLFTRVGSPRPSAADTYVLNALNSPHPNAADKYQQFPLERTYSEWAQSAFAAAPIDMGGRFGGNKRLVSTCQDCHLPDTSGSACAPFLGGAQRNDLPQHDFAGANSWVPLSIHRLDQSLRLYGPGEVNGEPRQVFQDALDRNVDMLRRACDLDLALEEGSLRVRITNQSGHKLPSGYPEGRRMWINVRYFDSANALIAERGAYDLASAALTANDTKVYEVLPGLDASVASATNLPAAPSFHFALNNKIYRDNRIPPRGFTNAAFEAVQAQPVGTSYADGQHWDDTLFAIPCAATAATVAIYHQTTSREYIEFLRSANTTNNAGRIAYDEWLALGKSAPVEMASATIQLTPRLSSDRTEISLASGGTQNLCINAGAAHAGQIYLLLGSLSGTSPGLTLGSVVLPLNPDVYFLHTLASPNLAPLASSLGNLDAQGRASAAFTLPPGLSPILAGARGHHAFALLDSSFTFIAASNPIEIRLIP